MYIHVYVHKYILIYMYIHIYMYTHVHTFADISWGVVYRFYISNIPDPCDEVLWAKVAEGGQGGGGRRVNGDGCAL